MMMVDPQTFDSEGGLCNVIRLEKLSDTNISDLDTQHVVRGGPFQGVIIRPQLDGEMYFRVSVTQPIFRELFRA